MNTGLFLNLVLAHLIGDFVLQTDNLCKKKREKGLKSWFMWMHPMIVAGLAWLLVGEWGFVWGAVVTFSSHLLIDAVKCRLERKGQHLSYFDLDQVLHLLVIGLLCWMHGAGWSQFEWVPEDYVLTGPATLCALILCVKPANILIKGVFESYQIEVPASKGKKNGNDLKNAGALIGSVERIIILILVLLGQYEAVGFVVAAKSLMRFKDSEGAKAEYVLVGTLLSLCVAIICAMGVIVVRGKNVWDGTGDGYLSWS